MQEQSVVGTSNCPVGLPHFKYICTAQGLFEMSIGKLRVAARYEMKRTL